MHACPGACSGPLAPSKRDGTLRRSDKLQITRLIKWIYYKFTLWAGAGKAGDISWRESLYIESGEKREKTHKLKFHIYGRVNLSTFKANPLPRQISLPRLTPLAKLTPCSQAKPLPQLTPYPGLPPYPG